MRAPPHFAYRPWPLPLALPVGHHNGVLLQPSRLLLEALVRIRVKAAQPLVLAHLLRVELPVFLLVVVLLDLVASLAALESLVALEAVRLQVSVALEVFVSSEAFVALEVLAASEALEVFEVLVALERVFGVEYVGIV